MVQLPEGAAEPRGTDNMLVKALARALRWRRMLDSGEFATIAELAECEGIASCWMTRVLRLTLLAPDIVKTILVGRQGLEPLPIEWAGQTESFCQVRGSRHSRLTQRSASPSAIVSNTFAVVRC